jgi:hypothetical protein
LVATKRASFPSRKEKNTLIKTLGDRPDLRSSGDDADFHVIWRGKAPLGFRDASVIGAPLAMHLQQPWSRAMPHGHAPGHIRDTFLEAVEAYANWEPGSTAPTVTREINYVPHEIGLADACRLVWNCTDVLPGDAYNILTRGCELPIQRRLTPPRRGLCSRR